MAYRIRRCPGFIPSRTSGSAREMMTDIEYSMKDFFTSFSMPTSITFWFSNNASSCCFSASFFSFIFTSDGGCTSLEASHFFQWIWFPIFIPEFC